MGNCGSNTSNPPELDALPLPKSSPLMDDSIGKSYPALRSFSDFEVMRMIGSGALGTVALVRLKSTMDLFAMKIVHKLDVGETEKKRKRMITEKYILEHSESPFLGSLRWSFQTLEYLFLVMDFYSCGNLALLQISQPHHMFSEETIRFFASQTVMALERLHILGYIYRDIKSENLVVSAQGHLVLIDFGFARQCMTPELHKAMQDPRQRALASARIGKATSFVGTSQFVAPEIIEGESQDSTVDWWSFGILLYQLLYGKTPFLGEDIDDTFDNIQHARLEFPKTRSVSSCLKKLIKALLRQDPNKRLGSRKGAEEIKSHEFFSGVHWDLKRYMQHPPAHSISHRPTEELMQRNLEQLVEEKDTLAMEYVKSYHDILNDIDIDKSSPQAESSTVWSNFSMNVQF